MNTIDAIMDRKSVRKYTDQEISDQDVETILKAGMSGPSCVNARDWSFIVVKDPDTLSKMAAANGVTADPLKNAKLGILICGDLDRSFPLEKDYWIIDGAIAGQNMVLAAEDLGIGSVWLGTYPQMSRVNKQKALFNLPDNIVPHSILAFGYPAPLPPYAAEEEEKPEWEEDRVHFEKW